MGGGLPKPAAIALLDEQSACLQMPPSLPFQHQRQSGGTCKPTGHSIYLLPVTWAETCSDPAPTSKVTCANTTATGRTVISKPWGQLGQNTTWGKTFLFSSCFSSALETEMVGPGKEKSVPTAEKLPFVGKELRPPAAFKSSPKKQ